MSQQKKNKIVAFVAILGVVVAISGGFVLLIPHLQNVAASSSPIEKTNNVNDQVPDSDGSRLGHVGMMRTINNTNCVSTPGGPQIC